MKIIYYHILQTGNTPVKKFLMKYDCKPTDKAKQQARKVKTLAFIDQVIQFIAEHNGKPVPPIAKTIRGYKFHELRIKEGSQLIRILYFCYHQERLVLLNAFQKPALYIKGAKKRVEKEIQKIFEQTNQYYDDFINNSQNYEEYY